MKKIWIGAAAVLSLTACDQFKERRAEISARKDGGSDPAAARDPLASNDANPVADDVARPDMQVQIALDRAGFSPGVIDGRQGQSTVNALKAFQQSRGIAETGKVDDATRAALGPLARLPATRVVIVPQDYVAGPYTPIPQEPEAKAKLAAMGYESAWERLAERFHTTPQVLIDLNRQADIAPPKPAANGEGAPGPATPPTLVMPPVRAGMKLRVPNVGADAMPAGSVDNAGWARTLTQLGVSSEQPEIARIRVSKAGGTLHAFDAKDRLVAGFSVTTGSEKDPLPLGNWTVKGVAFNPTYSYNPDLFWDADKGTGKLQYPAGPNSPVGVVWIDLDKPHYGIHGTPEPQTIGRAESYGCVRLTNWDAARLAEMVKPGVKVEFVA